MLDKLQKWVCRAVGPTFAASLEPLSSCQNVASVSLFYRYYFGRCSSELTKLVVPVHYSCGSKVLIGCTIFLGSFLDVIRMSSLLVRLGSGLLCLQNAFL